MFNYNVKFKNVIINALIDTGASCSLVIANKIKNYYFKKQKVLLANGENLLINGYCFGNLRNKYGETKSFKFYVVNNLIFDCIIRRDIICDLNLVYVDTLNAIKNDEIIFDNNISCNLTENEKNMLKNKLKNYKDVIYDGKNLSITNTLTYKIITNNNEPISTRPYCILHHLKDKMIKFIKEIIYKGYIRENQSPWCSPTMLVPKKKMIHIDYVLILENQTI